MVDTGEFRAMLQPTRFMRLALTLSENMKQGDIVSVQYWGNGKILVTNAGTNHAEMVTAHNIKGDWVAIGNDLLEK